MTFKTTVALMFVVLLLGVVLLPLGLFAFRLAVRQAKRDGSLTQY